MLLPDLVEAAAHLVEHVSPGDRPGVLAVVHLAAPEGSDPRWAGCATVYRDHASLQIDGLSREQVTEVLKALALRADVEALTDPGPLDHHRSGEQNVTNEEQQL